MAVSERLLPAILSYTIFLLLQSSALLPQSACSAQSSDGDGDSGLICELNDLKLSVARFESILEESVQSLHGKSLYLKEHEKLIWELSVKIHTLESTLFNIKENSSHVYKRLNALEEEVRLLWAASRKNNFDIHVLESKAKEAKDRLDVVTMKVEEVRFDLSLWSNV